MEKSFLSVAEAARYSSLGPRTLYQLCQDRKLRLYKIGKRIVIDPADLETLIKENCVEVVDWDVEAGKLR